MALKKFYGISTAQNNLVYSASHELAMQETAPTSGSTSEEVRKGSSERTHCWVMPANTGSTGWGTWDDSADISVDLSAFPSGLSLASDTTADTCYAIDTTDGSNQDTISLGSWSSTTGTGIKTRSESGTWSGTATTTGTPSFAIYVNNSDSKNNQTVTVDFSSADTWVEVSGSPPASYIAFVCGAECEYDLVGASTSHTHWDTFTDVSLSSTARTGDNAWLLGTTAGFMARDLDDEDAAGGDIYTRFYFRFDSVPTSDYTILQVGWSGNDSVVLYDFSAGVVGIDPDASGAVSSSTNNFTPVADTWYGIEMVATPSGGTVWRKWDATNGWSASESVSGTAGTWQTGLDLGWGDGGSSAAMLLDDVAIGIEHTTDDLFVTGAGTNGTDGFVLRHDPSSDGTHSFGTAGDFQHTGPTDASSSDTDLYTYLDSADPVAATDYIASLSGAATTEYVEVNFADESSYDDPRGVLFIGRTVWGGTAANGGRVQVSDDGTTWEEVYPHFNTSNADAVHQTRIDDIPSSGAAWTRTAVNSLRARLYGGASGEVKTHHMGLEVEWTTDEIPPVTGSFTVDADLQATMSGTFTTDAIVTCPAEGSFTADAWLQQAVAGSFTADALIFATVGASFTVDADILAVEVGTFSLDAVVQTTPTASFATDAILLVPQPGTVTANAVVERTIEAASSADAILSREVQAGFSLDAWLALAVGTVTGDFAADAVIQWEQTGTFTADAVRQEGNTGQFTADASIAATVSGSFTLDAQMAGAGQGAATLDAVVSLVGVCVWVSPANLSGITPTPTLVFRMPEASGNMHFQIELDTDSGFSDPTVVQSPGPGWQYWDGDSWESIPDGGVPNTYSGNEARYTVQSPLSQATWYRRVRAGVI